jgi:hypothetical protein
MLALLLLLAAEPSPSPSASPSPTPAATPVRVPATGQYGRPRTLSDVARERKLAAGKSGGSVTVASGRAGAPAKGSPSPESGAVPAATPADDGPRPQLSIESVATNDVVGAKGETGVFGKIRNSGSGPACNVRVAIKVYDERNVFLASGEAPADQSLINAGETVTFSTTVQLPPGVAGGRKEKSVGYGTTKGGGTLEGQWRILGAAEASISSYSTTCIAKPLKNDD